MALMVSVSGIRGIFGTDLTPQNLTTFAAAYGTWIGGGKVVVGRDSRTTGEICENIVVSTLASVGCDVVKVGIVPTPTVEMGVLKHNADGGIIISASHNPAEWNALKLLNGKSEFLSADEGAQVLDIHKREAFDFKPYDQIGEITTDDSLLHYHITKILDLPYIDAEFIGAQNFSVAVDAVNGAGSIAVPAMLKALGVETVNEIFTTPNGLFPHNPEPLPEHLEEICTLIKENPVDIGFVVDPDADRLAVVDEHGKLWGEEYTLPAALDLRLDYEKGPVVVNLSSSMINDEMAKHHDVECHRSAVGEINVVEKMHAVNSAIGGEGNGGVINSDLHYGRDSLVGIAMILQLLAERGVTASEYRSGLPNFVITKNKATLEGINADEILESIKIEFADQNPDTTDGVKILFDKSWVHLRKSNTEPIIRIYTEAETKEKAEELAQQFITLIEK